MFQKIKKFSAITGPSIKTYVIAAVLVFLAFMGVTLWSWNNARSNIETDMQKSLESGMTSASDLITNTISTYGEVLKGAAGLFVIKPGLTQDDWQRYTQNLDFQNRYPGLSGMGYSQYVRSSELSQFLENTRRSDGRSYDITPATPRDVYIFSRFVELGDNANSASLQTFDAFTEPIRREAMETARDTGQLAVSGPVVRIRDQQKGFNLYHPIYRQDAPISTVEERRAAIIGYVSAGVRISDLLEGLFAKALNDNAAIQFYSSAEPKPENLVYQSASFDKLIKQPDLFTASREIKATGHSWTIVAYANSSFSNQTQRKLPQTILLGGLALSVLISSLLYIIMLSRARSLTSEKNKEVQEVKDSLIALASHQLRTPATGVKQFIGMVLEGYVGKVTPEQRNMLERAYLSNERQLEIINQILHVTRADAGRLELSKERLNINELVRSVISDLKPTTDVRKQRIVLSAAAKTMYIQADKQYLCMAIENLLSNASKYSPVSKRITISTKRLGDMVVISVADKGVGIEERDMHLLFQKFSRIHNELSVEAGGNGIGLYLAHEIVALHGGHIEVVSEPGKGSVFTIFLPRKTTE